MWGDGREGDKCRVTPDDRNGRGRKGGGKNTGKEAEEVLRTSKSITYSAWSG